MSTAAQAALEKQLQMLAKRSEERIADAAELVALTSAMCEVARLLLNRNLILRSALTFCLGVLIALLLKL